jgi:hypothetical protein
MPFDALAGFETTPLLSRHWKNRIITRHRTYLAPLIWPSKEAARKRAKFVMSRARPNNYLNTMGGGQDRKCYVRAIVQVRW